MQGRAVEIKTTIARGVLFETQTHARDSFGSLFYCNYRKLAKIKDAFERILTRISNFFMCHFMCQNKIAMCQRFHVSFC